MLAIPDDEAKSFQDDFAELARSDADALVRRAALSKLLDGKHLAPFLTDADPEIVRAAAEAIARDIDSAELLNHPKCARRQSASHAIPKACRTSSATLRTTTS